MILFDTNVLLDIATADPVWLPCEGHTLVTRDAARYRTYFPSVALIAPP